MVENMETTTHLLKVRLRIFTEMGRIYRKDGAGSGLITMDGGVVPPHETEQEMYMRQMQEAQKGMETFSLPIAFEVYAELTLEELSYIANVAHPFDEGVYKLMADWQLPGGIPITRIDVVQMLPDDRAVFDAYCKEKKKESGEES